MVIVELIGGGPAGTGAAVLADLALAAVMAVALAG
jgi:hypothetical protein